MWSQKNQNYYNLYLSVTLQKFHGTLSMSIYRDFMVHRVCQLTEISHDPAKHLKSL